MSERATNLALLATVVAGAVAIGILVAGVGPQMALIAAGLLIMATIATWPRSRAFSRVSTVSMLLLVYLIPLVTFGRAFALIGHRPVFLADVLVALAALLMLRGLRIRTTAPLTSLCIAIALLACQCVYVGYVHEYTGAIRGLVLGFYPLVAAITAAWLAQQRNLMTLLSYLPRLILPLIPLGLAVAIAVSRSEIPAAYGLYLGSGASFAMVPGMPRRRLLIASSIVGFLLLAAVDAKRGPALAIILGACASWLAASAFGSRSTRSLAAIAILCCVSCVGLLVSSNVLAPTRLPVVGQLASRALGGSGTSSASNVVLREDMWDYALGTTLRHEPLTGMGASHPIEVTLGSERVADEPETGPHNSFVGYAFYAGFPAALLVCTVFALALWRCWAIRRRCIYAPALFGALVVAIATAMTNVALETTYIGGPSWMLIAAAFGLYGHLRSTTEQGGAETSTSHGSIVHD